MLARVLVIGLALWLSGCTDRDTDDDPEADRLELCTGYCDRLFSGPECSPYDPPKSRQGCIDECVDDPIWKCDQEVAANYGCLNALSCEEFYDSQTDSANSPCVDETIAYSACVNRE